jgi:hypothetical protein
MGDAKGFSFADCQQYIKRGKDSGFKHSEVLSKCSAYETQCRREGWHGGCDHYGVAAKQALDNLFMPKRNLFAEAAACETCLSDQSSSAENRFKMCAQCLDRCEAHYAGAVVPAGVSAVDVGCGRISRTKERQRVLSVRALVDPYIAGFRSAVQKLAQNPGNDYDIDQVLEKGDFLVRQMVLSRVGVFEPRELEAVKQQVHRAAMAAERSSRREMIRAHAQSLINLQKQRSTLLSPAAAIDPARYSHLSKQEFLDNLVACREENNMLPTVVQMLNAEIQRLSL